MTKMDTYQQFIAKSRYSRFLSEQNRRENWNETVARYFNFMEDHLQKNNNYALTRELRNKLESAVVNLEVMPSMRSIMTAGKALERDNTAGYNCSYLPIDDPKAFDEAMYILLCGTGVGFSVEQKYVNQLPEVPDQLFDSQTTIVVADSKEGWAKALRQLLALLYSGEIPKWDLSKVRPAGARLKTFGGRASGPAPLEELFKFSISKFKGALGRRLTSLECHDILCKIGEVVVVGGVRRSAMISLSDLQDDKMRNAKSGAWWEQNGQRALANNSATYTQMPDTSQFLHEWTSLYDSHSGERGIFSREASEAQAKKTNRRSKKIKVTYEDGTVKTYNGNEIVGGKSASDLKVGDDV
jgi:ribonucleoside-triphosphate reductase